MHKVLHPQPDLLIMSDEACFFSALLNLLEAFGNLVYLYMTEVSGNPIAPLFGFGATLTTCSKTILYEAQEYFCNWCATGHNTQRDLILFYLFPTK
jgi:hypothetical protein